MGDDDFNPYFVHINHYCGTTINAAWSAPRTHAVIPG